MGGNFFFPPEVPPYIVLTDNEEAADILNDEEFPENGLKVALVTHLLTSAHIMLSGGTVCNFLLHPSMKTEQHKGFAEKIFGNISAKMNDVVGRDCRNFRRSKNG